MIQMSKMSVYIKEKIKYLDKRYLHGKIFSSYVKYINNKKRNFFNHKGSVILNEPVFDMILMQNNIDSVNGRTRIAGYDIAVRLLFIEQYYGKNQYGYALYKKMHTLRGNYGQVNEAERIYNEQRAKGKPVFHGQGREEHSIEQFERLIVSCEHNGFNESSVIMADKNLLNINGSHRLSMALFKGKPFIKTEVHNTVFHRGYELDWFWAHGFNNDEIEIIKKKWNDIVQNAKEKVGFFYCILFPPAEDYFEDITNDINQMMDDNISVAKTDEYIWEVDDFVNFLKAVYHFDSINTINLQRKIMYILKSSKIDDDKVRFRILQLKIKNPYYRLKSDNGMPESLATVRLKEMIRARYRVKESKFTAHYEGDYAHDVIIHSSDNYISNNAFKFLLSAPRDISAVIEIIRTYNHAFAVISNDKISRAFPHNYYLGEDFDIFVQLCDLEDITRKVYEKCLEVFGNDVFTVAIEDSLDGKRVRIEYYDFTLTMFDFMVTFNGIRKERISNFLDEKVDGCITHLSQVNEAIYRINKFRLNDTKEYHLKYLKQIISKNNYDEVRLAFESTLRDKVDSILELIGQ